MDMHAELQALVSEIQGHLEGAQKVTDQSHGWKTANKGIRKMTLSVEKKLKALRKSSIELEK